MNKLTITALAAITMNDVGALPVSQSVPVKKALMAKCPAWASDGGESYTYTDTEWTQGHLFEDGFGYTGTPMRTDVKATSTTMGTSSTPSGYFYNNGTLPSTNPALTNTICAWVAACDGNDDCIARTPVAVAIMYGESNFNPNAQSWDGKGRGIIQVNYDNLPTGEGWDCAGATDCSKSIQKDGNNVCDRDQSKYPATPDNGILPRAIEKCAAYNPVKLLKYAISNPKITNDGADFNGALWYATCRYQWDVETCARTTTPAWAKKDMCPNLAAISEDAKLQELTTEIVAELTGKAAPSFKSPDACTPPPSPKPPGWCNFVCNLRDPANSKLICADADMPNGYNSDLCTDHGGSVWPCTDGDYVDGKPAHCTETEKPPAPGPGPSPAPTPSGVCDFVCNLRDPANSKLICADADKAHFPQGYNSDICTDHGGSVWPCTDGDYVDGEPAHCDATEKL